MTRKLIPGLSQEPSLADVLDDPVVQAVMAGDRVKRTTLEALIADIQRRLAGQAAAPRQVESGGRVRREPYLFAPR
ncbi:MAG TPA: hypothetical protein VLG66_01280 [Alphaproteobacteria bacterium]|jgi:hypothetical protein|nr:hypothetical protein [Alphaproteobacteria bacterium]